MDKVIQIANLDPNSTRENSNNLRVYDPSGISPCLNSGEGWKTPCYLRVAKRYALGRTNGGGKNKGRNGTVSFHVLRWFNCVTSSRFSNREQWILEIGPNR